MQFPAVRPLLLRRGALGLLAAVVGRYRITQRNWRNRNKKFAAIEARGYYVIHVAITHGSRLVSSRGRAGAGAVHRRAQRLIFDGWVGS